MSKTSELTRYERDQIEYYRKLRMGVRAIGRKIGRDHGVISRELKRNTGSDGRYRAAEAQRRADRRGRKTNVRKLETDPLLRKHVIDQLKEGISPEQIAGRMKHQPPPSVYGQTVSHETIYAYIYDSDEGRWLYRYLRKKNAPRRQKHYSRKRRQTSMIPNRISIHDRPPVVAAKTRFGDWESDTMVFTKQREAVSVQYERKSMTVRLHKVSDRSALKTEMAIRDTISSVPQPFVQSITFDNGGEGATHTHLRYDYGIETYFCDAYASWQKGGVENMNGLVRQYLPRITDLSTISEGDVEEIQDRLNNRPRKSLGYLTPNEVLQNAIAGGALNP